MNVRLLEDSALELCLERLDVSEDIACALRSFHHTVVTCRKLTARLVERHAALFNSTYPNKLGFGLSQLNGETDAMLDALACLVEMPNTLTRYRQLGMPTASVKECLADFEIWMCHYHSRTGYWGIAEADWVALSFACKVFRLGRLQFEPGRFKASDFRRVNHRDLPDSSNVLRVHIPASGRLCPDACTDSLTRALNFFTRNCFNRSYVAFLCHSWILDRQFMNYLAADSNIVQFSKRFAPLEPVVKSDVQTMERVFGAYPVDINTAPQDTLLQRVIIAHIRRGGSWGMGAGYIRI